MPDKITGVPTPVRRTKGPRVVANPDGNRAERRAAARNLPKTRTVAKTPTTR